MESDAAKPAIIRRVWASKGKNMRIAEAVEQAKIFAISMPKGKFLPSKNSDKIHLKSVPKAPKARRIKIFTSASLSA